MRRESLKTHISCSWSFQPLWDETLKAERQGMIAELPAPNFTSVNINNRINLFSSLTAIIFIFK
jgi:hypothetical protein